MIPLQDKEIFTWTILDPSTSVECSAKHDIQGFYAFVPIS